MPWSSAAQSSRPGPSSPGKKFNKIVPIIPPQGINQVDPLAGEFPPLDGIYMNNWIATRYGTKVRTGYAHYSDAVDVGGVKSIIPFNGSVSTNDKLFAAGSSGIYDISAGPAVSAIAFPGATSLSGHGQWCAFTTLSGFNTTYTDEQYGYYLYTETGNTWAAVTNTQVTGVDPALFVDVCAYRARLWFVERGSSRAWFLPTGAIIGAATVFDFGNKFKHGGNLQALYTWVNDSLNLTEYLVAISSTGEVIVYTGIDPTDASNFSEAGSWFIGNVPIGRRLAGAFGGDLYLLSIYGLLPISKLVTGQIPEIDAIELSRKISPAIQSTMAETFQTLGWEVRFVPSENAVIIATPQQVGVPFTQFVLALNNQGWCTYLDMPVYTGEMWNGAYYFGALDGNVYAHTGTQDNVPLNSSIGTNILATLLGGYFDYQEPGQYHIAQAIRPVFLTQTPPSFTCQIQYDYDLSNNLAPSLPIPVIGSVWDIGTWDNALWGGQFITSGAVQGAYGQGRAMAVALGVSASDSVTILRFDLTFETGDSL